MKAAPFAYARPTTLEAAITELAARPGDAKVLAGGQSLVPILAMRLARPALLVDLNAVRGLDGLGIAGGHLEVGANVRQRRVETRPGLAGEVPLLAMALPWVGHRELRSRGTVCGSLAHADPAAELPAVACCLGATVTVAGPGGTREVAARDFFTGALTTTTGPDEVVTTARFPVARPGETFGFAEVARRHGDFALAGVAVRVGPEGEATLCAFGVSDRPVTVDVTAAGRAALDAARPGGDDAEPAVIAALETPMAALAGEVVDTAGDPHGSAPYRRRLLAALAASQLGRALTRREVRT